MAERPDEALARVTERLSELFSSEDGTQALALVQRLALLARGEAAPAKPRSDPGSLALGIWEPEADADGNVAQTSTPKEIREFDGRQYVLETALTADFGLVRAAVGDRHGNLVFHESARNFNPLAGMAGRITVAEVEELVEPGEIRPEDVHLPGVFVNRVVVVGTEGKGIEYRTNRPRTDRSAAPAAAGDEATEGDAR